MTHRNMGHDGFNAIAWAQGGYGRREEEKKAGSMHCNGKMFLLLLSDSDGICVMKYGTILLWKGFLFP